MDEVERLAEMERQRYNPLNYADNVPLDSPRGNWKGGEIINISTHFSQPFLLFSHLYVSFLLSFSLLLSRARIKWNIHLFGIILNFCYPLFFLQLCCQEKERINEQNLHHEHGRVRMCNYFMVVVYLFKAR